MGKDKKDVPVELSVRVTFGEPLLGTAPLDPEIFKAYVTKGILSEEEEVGSLPGVDEDEKPEAERKPSQVTGFHRENGHIFLYDYQVKGFFKDACGSLKRAGYTMSNPFTAYKKKIDGLVFVEPRRIPIALPDGCDVESIEILSRPLRASTPQGDRVAIASSEVAPAGSTMELRISSLSRAALPAELVQEWLGYGALRGFGAWRNAGYGRFTWEALSQS